MNTRRKPRNLFHIPYIVFSTYFRAFSVSHQVILRSILYSYITENSFKDALKLFDDFKNKQESVWSNDFWYVKVYISWKGIQCSIHWNKIQMLKNISLDKINSTENALFFLSQAPIHYSFTFNLRSLYELKYKVCLSKPVCGIFHFRFRFVLLKFIFLFNKMHRLFDFKTS